MADTAEIHIRIDGEAGLFVATTPHVPELEARSDQEHLAVNELLRQVRQHCETHRRRGEPVPWRDGDGAASGQDRIVRHLTGVAPPRELRAAPAEHDQPLTDEE